jgi:predicted nucleotidyltransferase
MDDATGNSGRAAALDFVKQVARAWDRHLGPRLAGIYLIGSLAHGGFSARYSDIDIALIAEDLLTAGEIDRIRVEMHAVSAELAARLSVFWTDQHFSAGRFPPLDRIDYLDHAVVLRERRRVYPPRPTLPEVRAYLAAAPFENWLQEVTRLSALDELTSSDHKRYLRALLYPARFLYSWVTGKIASNDDAVAFLRHRADVGVDLDIIARALACRNDGASPAPLFAERSKLLGLLDSCKRVMATEPLS